MPWEACGVVGFDLWPLLQGQTRIAKLESAYNSLIIGPRGLGWSYFRPSIKLVSFVENLAEFIFKI